MKSRMGRNPFEKPAHAKVVRAQVRDASGASATSHSRKPDSLFTRVATYALIDLPAEAVVLGIRAAALAKDSGICSTLANVARRKRA